MFAAGSAAVVLFGFAAVFTGDHDLGSSLFAYASATRSVRIPEKAIITAATMNTLVFLTLVISSHSPLIHKSVTANRRDTRN